MDRPAEAYWRIRLAECAEILGANHFEAHVVDTADAARELVLQTILPATGAKTVSWGGSMTLHRTGLCEAMRCLPEVTVIDTFDRSVSPEEAHERRRQALLSDLFLTGANAITETGSLVNLDMHGNRVAAVTFGPRHVVVLAGRNKIVPDLEEAMLRIKNYAAPVNAMRLDKRTPCVKTSACENCKSPDRICNTWTITEKSLPKGRIKVVLINEDLGL